MSQRFVVWMVVCTATACSNNGSDCTPGSERCACRDDGSCDAGLTCAGLCVRVSGGDVATGGDPLTGDTMTGDTMTGDTMTGDTMTGDTMTGDPMAGDPMAGDPMTGDTMAGDTMAGDTMAGDTMAGDTMAGDTMAGDPDPGDPMPITGSVSFSWTVEGAAASGACADFASVVVGAVTGPSTFSQSVSCTTAGVQVDDLLPGGYTLTAILLDTYLVSSSPQLDTTVVAGQTTPVFIDFRWRGNPIQCDWDGARWLSHGYDGGAYATIGAWVTCTSGVVAYMEWIENGTLGVSPSPNGTEHVQVGCNWAGERWVSQGIDGGGAFTEGSTVTCADGQVASMSWEGDTVGSGTSIAGDLECNWTGAKFLSHGWDGGCAFDVGIAVTCNQGLITDVQWLEGSCGRAR